jgi:hypothetical protein
MRGLGSWPPYFCIFGSLRFPELHQSGKHAMEGRNDLRLGIGVRACAQSVNAVLDRTILHFSHFAAAFLTL